MQQAYIFKRYGRKPLLQRKDLFIENTLNYGRTVGRTGRITVDVDLKEPNI